MAHWKLLMGSIVAFTALSAATAAESARLNEPANVATWLLGAGWLLLAFSLGVVYQRVLGLGEWTASISQRVRILEQQSAPSQAVLSERVDGLREDVAEIKAAVAEIRSAMVRQTRAAVVGD